MITGKISEHNLNIWREASFNNGWVYKHFVRPKQDGIDLINILSSNYLHSSRETWNSRLLDGQISVNGIRLLENSTLKAGDCLSWERPPWKEPAVPFSFDVIFDNGDLLVINKPSGLPVIPGGGFMMHTLTNLLSIYFKSSEKNGFPKPIHRLGRFTSGLLICARKESTRASVSSFFRSKTQQKECVSKSYRALAIKSKNLDFSSPILVDLPIQKFPHELLGYVWSADKGRSNSCNQLEAVSKVNLLERRSSSDLLDVTIATGRPHQIRIHLSAIGIPLVGDPLYLPGGEVVQTATPGAGGYLLHAHKILALPIDGKLLSFEAPPPKLLCQINEID